MAEENKSALHFEENEEIVNWKKEEQDNERLLNMLVKKYEGSTLTKTDIKAFILGWKAEGEEKLIEALDKSIEWRKQMNFPEVMEKPINDEQFYAKIPLCVFQLGRCGNPVYYIDIAKLDVDNDDTDLRARDLTDRVNLHLREIQRRVAEYKGNPESMWRSIVVLNMDGIGVWQAKSRMGLVQHVIQTGNDMFGTNLEKCYLINCGWSIRMILALVMTFVHEETKQKIVRCGTDFLTELQKSVPLAQIPKRFGGKCQDDWISGGIVLPAELEYPYKLM